MKEAVVRLLAVVLVVLELSERTVVLLVPVGVDVDFEVVEVESNLLELREDFDGLPVALVFEDAVVDLIVVTVVVFTEIVELLD